MRKYTTPKDRFQPFKNIIIDKEGMKKSCSKCFKFKLLHENFNYNKRYYYGYMSQCKQCQADYQVLWKAKKKG